MSFGYTGADEPQKIRTKSGRTVRPAEVASVYASVERSEPAVEQLTLEQRRITIADDEEHYTRDPEFCEFQHLVAQQLSKPGPVCDELIVYWESDDGDIIAIDPKDDDCPDVLCDVYEKAKSMFQENGADIERACKQKLAEALKATMRGATADEGDEDYYPDIGVSYSRFFSMINKKDEWQDFVASHAGNDQTPSLENITVHRTSADSVGQKEDLQAEPEGDAQERCSDNLEKLVSFMRNQVKDDATSQEESSFSQDSEPQSTGSDNLRLAPLAFEHVSNSERQERLSEPEQAAQPEAHSDSSGAKPLARVPKKQPNKSEPLVEDTGAEKKSAVTKNNPPSSVLKKAPVKKGQATNVSMPDDLTDMTQTEAVSILRKVEKEFLDQENKSTLMEVMKAQVARVDDEYNNQPFKSTPEQAPIGTAIKRLVEAAEQGEKGRFQSFFDDSVVQELSGIERYTNDRKAEGQALDDNLIEYFITAYKAAVMAETKTGSPDQLIKKVRRIKAINAIEEYIKGRTGGPQHKKDSLLACQMLLRIREPGFVHQRDTPRCGGFALLQNLWRTRPDKATNVLLGMNGPLKAAFVKAQNGLRVKLVPPDPSVMERYKEDLADKLLIHSLYKSPETGSTSIEDAYRAYFFDKKAMQCQKVPQSGHEQERFLQILSDATKKKCAVSLSFDGQAADILKKEHEKNRQGPRKSERGDDFKVPDFSKGNGNTGHAVLVDQLSFNESNVELKLHSWGKTTRYTISRDQFFKLIVEGGESTTIYVDKPDDNFKDVFSEPPYQITFKSDGRAIYHDCTGEKAQLQKSRVHQGLDGVSYLCDEQGNSFPASGDEKFLSVKNTSEWVTWNYRNNEEEQVLKGLFNNNFYVVNDQGKGVPASLGNYVKGPNGDKYYFFFDNGGVLTPKEDERVLPLVLKGSSDCVVWDDKSGKKEQVLLGRPSHNVYVVNEEGEATLMQLGKYVYGPEGDTQYCLTHNENGSIGYEYK